VEKKKNAGGMLLFFTGQQKLGYKRIGSSAFKKEEANAAVKQSK
jgi:hypothetical protein